MTARFADTYYFAALLNRHDDAHNRALSFARLRQPVITTPWVLIELADGLSNTAGRAHFKLFLSRIRLNPLITILAFDHEIFDRAVDLYDGRRDKRWSLTDCISFIIMQDHGLTDALTGDHHFEQAGFHAILK